MVKLSIEESGQPTRSLAVANGTHFMGRRAECSVRLANDTVSKRHAELVVSDGRAEVRDLASTGGLFVNGEMVRHAVLKVGDVIKLGTVFLRVDGIA